MSATARFRAQVSDWLMEQTPQERRHLSFFLLAVALYSIHYVAFCWPQPFFIEDSAISFSYGRHLFQGEGLVPFAGGERIEGYSNPLWTALIGFTWWLGAEVWYSSKILGYVFGIMTMWLSYLIGRRVRPGELDAAPLLGPFLLAGSTQFVLWNASGLENPLFNLLLALGIYATIRESEDNRIFPWSALAWLGLCLTRPEGVAYAAVGLVGRVAVTLWATFKPGATQRWRGWVALLLWILLLVLPFAAYQAWRYDYFAWIWPNTYYAKEKTFRPFNWGGGGWPKFREYMLNYGIIFAAPALAMATLGMDRLRRAVGYVLLVGLAILVLWDGKAGIPASFQNPAVRWLGTNWVNIRVWYILGIGLFTGLATMGYRGWEARTMLWATWCTALFFQIFSGGDWMKGFRWFSLATVPQFTLIGVGLYALAELIPKAEKRILGQYPAAVLYAGVGTFALMCANIPHSYDFVLDAETAVRDVHQRVRYMTGVQKKLSLDQVTLLDVDMGAHLWYTDWTILDLAGLVDVPVARHDWQKAFTEDYILAEYRPDFAHVHGAWARSTRVTDQPGFKEDYLEIPGYPTGGRTLHVGNHIRKELVVGKTYGGPPDRWIRFGRALLEEVAPAPEGSAEGLAVPDGGWPAPGTGAPPVPRAGEVVLEGWDIPAPQVAPGGRLYVDTTWTANSVKNFRVHVFLYNEQGEVHSAEVSPAFDWYKAEKWKADEHVYGRWGVPIPEDMPLGRWSVGLVLLSESLGEVIPSQQVADEARYMVGEVQLGTTVEIVSFEEAHRRAADVLDLAVSRAGAGDCEASEEGWRTARRHVLRDVKWHDEREPRWTTAMVHCLVERAAKLTDPEEKAVPLMLAWRLDHNNDRLLAAVTPLGEQLEAIGDARALSGDWEGAFRAFSAAVKVDARRSWARRKAEECRDRRLSLKPKDFTWEKNLFPYEEPPAKKPKLPVRPVGKDKKAKPEAPDAPAGTKPEEAPVPDEPAEEAAGE